MPCRLAPLAALLILAGCASTPSSVTSPPPASAPAAKAVSPLAGISPADRWEADLIAHPDDARSLGDHAKVLQNRAAATDDPEQARALRRKARAFAAAAVAAGSKDLLMTVILQQVQEDGTEIPNRHSNDAAAHALVADGEKLFARGDLEGALAFYLKAWALDPRSDHAALFIGDVYFVNKDNLRAIEWFDRAIAIAPLNSTAHRYRADALMRLRRFDDARDGYIAALLASPYHPITRAMLPQWAQQARRSFNRPDISFPRGQIQVVDKKVELIVDPDVGALNLMYVAARSKYATERKEGLAAYRHTLDEEAAALRAVLQVASELREVPDAAAELEKREIQLRFLQRLEKDGLLEAHVLLDRPTEGIAQDYASYLASHRDRLDRYVREIWLGEK